MNSACTQTLLAAVHLVHIELDKQKSGDEHLRNKPVKRNCGQHGSWDNDYGWNTAANTTRSVRTLDTRLHNQEGLN